MRKLSILVGLMAVLLAGCFEESAAPVEELVKHSRDERNSYQVRRGDTLYSIAWAYEMDYQRLAQINQLAAPYLLYVGQKLRLSGQVSPQTVQNFRGHVSQNSKKIEDISAFDVCFPVKWSWPVNYTIKKGFSYSALGNKGIDFAGFKGVYVKSSAKGVVVYSGAGVRGYGNLVIIKHSKDYLSAYAYNERNLVTVGQVVSRGQPIAMMGEDDAGHVLLHFEIRWDGKPVNPITYLPPRG